MGNTTPKKIHEVVYQYPVIVQTDVTGGYWVSCPAFEGCYSQGETVDAALENIKEAIALCREETERREPHGDVSLHLVRASLCQSLPDFPEDRLSVIWNPSAIVSFGNA